MLAKQGEKISHPMGLHVVQRWHTIWKVEVLVLLRAD